MADYGPPQRYAMAKKGRAMPDPNGGPPKFPIATTSPPR